MKATKLRVDRGGSLYVYDYFILNGTYMSSKTFLPYQLKIVQVNYKT